MSDDQKRSLDYCTQNYLERILQIKSFFSSSTELLIKNKIELTDTKINKGNLLLCADLMKQILQGEYRNVDGEERLQVADDRYVKINFSSSGQQEAIWILNVLFYYLLNKAIQQIKDREYALRFAAKFVETEKYTGRILAVGISYDKNTKKHECKIEELK